VHWGWAGKAFHWITALIILVIAPAGYVMGRTYMAEYSNPGIEQVNNLVGQIHHTGGLLIIPLVIARLVWRRTNLTPGISDRHGRALRWLAMTNHSVLYVLIFAIALSGWSAVSSFADATVRFFTFEGPRIVPSVPLGSTFDYSFFIGVHKWALFIGFLALLLHIVSALWHEFRWRDSVLRRMWPLAAPRDAAKRELSS
jgi:cytochrome b561